MDQEDRITLLEKSVTEIKDLVSKLSIQNSSVTDSQPNTPAETDTVQNPSVDNQPPQPTADIAQATNIYSEDAQAAYASIRASVSSVRLPAELTVCSSGAGGLKKGDAAIHALITKVARITETCIKLMKAKSDPYDDMFTCLQFLIRQLQDEQANLLVQASFDPTVARFFRNLRKGSGLNQDALEDLRSAASIAAVYRPAPAANRGFQAGRGFRLTQRSLSWPGGHRTHQRHYPALPCQNVQRQRRRRVTLRVLLRVALQVGRGGRGKPQ